MQMTRDNVHTFHPNQNECFLLRLLLVNVRGPNSFQQLRIINGVTHATLRSVHHVLNLLEKDSYRDLCINEACNTSHRNQVLAFFAIILTACSPSSSTELWQKYKVHMAEIIFRSICRES